MALLGGQFAAPALAAAAAPAVAAPTAVLPGAATSQAIERPAIVNNFADSQNRYTSQVVDNRNDVFINQPIINNRDHYINNLNTQIIRDNNFYHYNTQNLYRDNVINTYQNQVVRQQFNYSTASQTFGRLPGSVSNINYGTQFLNGGAVWGAGLGYGWGAAAAGWAGRLW